MAERKFSLLLVDDEVNFLWSVARALRLTGYDITTAESGEEALAALGRRHYDLVLTDVRMPGMDGFELVEWLRQNRPEMLVVMTTAYGSYSVRERSLRLGALTYLEKPLDLKALVDFLDRLFFTPNFAGRIHDIDLLDYLQLIITTHKAKIVQVMSGNAVGRLAFSAGRLIDAQCGEKIGTEAFYEIISWNRGTFTDLPFVSPDQVTIHDNTSYLLLEAARLRDESSINSQPREKAVRIPPDVLGDVAMGDQAANDVAIEGIEAGQDPFDLGLDQLLTTLCQVDGVRGAILMTHTGESLASAGDLPSGWEPLVTSFAAAADAIGDGMELGTHDSGTLKLSNGEIIYFEPVGDYLMGAWLSSRTGTDAIAKWLNKHRSQLM